MPHHARTAAWTSTATRRWLASCDVCRTWRLVADYYECYAPNGTGGGWWWSCGGCLLDVVDDLRAAVTAAAAGVVEADQCWHQQSWDAGEYDGDFHPGECFGLAICDDPCRLCLLTRVVEPDHDPDWLDEDDAALDLARQMVGWDALPSPCTEHGMESCPCEEGATYPPHDAASERLGECRACHEADELGREHMERVYAAHQPEESLLRDLNEDDRKALDWMDGYLRCQTREARHFYLHLTDAEHTCKDFGPPPQHIDVWIGDAFLGHATFVEFVHAPTYENTLVDTQEKAAAAASAVMEGMSGRPQPGQALRHGAPCFLDGTGHKAESGQQHIIATHPTCSACVRYRNHLDISFEEAQRIALDGLHERADPTHSCLACSWGR